MIVKAWSLRLIGGGFISFLTVVMGLLFIAAPVKIVFAIILGVGVFLCVIVRSHSRSTSYICKSCSTPFKASPRVNFCSPHIPNRKLLRCQHCGNIDWHPTE